MFKYGEAKLKADTESSRLLAEACSVFPEFNHLRLLKEGFERIYDCTNKKEALEAFNYWRQFVPPTAAKARMEWEEKYGVPAELYETLKPLERTVGTTWHREIFNYFEDSNTMKITNAIAESTNSFVTNFSCKGYKFSRLRSKALFWHEVTERKRYILETRKELKLKTGKSKQAGRKTSDVSYDMFNLFTSHNRNNDIYSELFEKVPVYGLFEVTEKIERKPLSVLSYLSPERKAEWNEAVRSLNNI